MTQQEVVWLRVRGRDGDRQVRKKLRVSLRHLATMDLAQFRQFLVSDAAPGRGRLRVWGGGGLRVKGGGGAGLKSADEGCPRVRTGLESGGGGH